MGKRATKNMQLVSQQLSSDVVRFTPHIEPVLQQIRLLTGLRTRVVKRAISFFDSLCSKGAKQVARFCCLVRKQFLFCLPAWPPSNKIEKSAINTQ